MASASSRSSSWSPRSLDAARRALLYWADTLGCCRAQLTEYGFSRREAYAICAFLMAVHHGSVIELALKAAEDSR
jgi:hypothetical protein